MATKPTWPLTNDEGRTIYVDSTESDAAWREKGYRAPGEKAVEADEPAAPATTKPRRGKG